MRILQPSRFITLVAALIGVIVLCGCAGFSYSEPPPPKLGEPSETERQRRADTKAQQLGEKPTPVDHSRK